jgi:hypothetical protein
MDQIATGNHFVTKVFFPDNIHTVEEHIRVDMPRRRRCNTVEEWQFSSCFRLLVIHNKPAGHVTI